MSRIIWFILHLIYLNFVSVLYITIVFYSLVDNVVGGAECVVAPGL